MKPNSSKPENPVKIQLETKASKPTCNKRDPSFQSPGEYVSKDGIAELKRRMMMQISRFLAVIAVVVGLSGLKLLNVELKSIRLCSFMLGFKARFVRIRP